MGNGQWAMGNGQWVMGNGQWKFRISYDKFFPCPMPHDGRCYNGGNLRNALPPPCPIPALSFI
ncbi:hypothetical protein H6G81_00705 [Scytonema hofmannii FACHB-248]|uniref:Uncharacterized protein n=1 Tax=Scytonema hofmannii FACHB-248 TaxID=1842502 RepID=A0ABR8GIV5_9CYAN|nr:MULTISPECIES: hypothetical protein [Nostocales]MBD2603076.1 hypothetical protein [Scytonema hofmannii FACHB-248]